jgi:hypothetical protein
MNGILTSLAVLVIIGWGIGYFGYHEGGMFHLILVVGIIAISRQLLPVRKPSNKVV